MKRYVLAPDAVEDLDDIWEYIARDDVRAADRFVAKLQREVRSLVETPGMGHRREDLAGPRPLPFWPVGDYLILYRSNKGRIEVVAFVRSRDIPSLIQRRGL